MTGSFLTESSIPVYYNICHAYHYLSPILSLAFRY